MWFDPSTGVFVKIKLISMYGPEPSRSGMDGSFGHDALNGLVDRAPVNSMASKT